MQNKDFEDFSNPYRRYRGNTTPQNLIFDANLQEFAYRINVICNLENNGKIGPKEAYKQIRELWRQLKKSKKMLFKPQDNEPDSSTDV